MAKKQLHDVLLEVDFDVEFDRFAGLVFSGDPDRLAEEFAARANWGDEMALRWISRLQELPADQLLSVVNSLTHQVQIVCSYRLNRESSKFELQMTHFHRRPGEKVKPLFPSAETVFAWILMRLINAGIAETVKKCEAFAANPKGKPAEHKKLCPNYFFGRANKRYCSNACRTRVNIAAKRDSDRKQVML